MTNLQQTAPDARADVLTKLDKSAEKVSLIDRRRAAALTDRNAAVIEARALGIPAWRVAAQARVSEEMVRRIVRGGN